MTETEIRRLQRMDNPSSTPRYKRKNKLKMRFKGQRLVDEINSTTEKLQLLTELACEEAQRRASSFSGS